MLFDFGIIYCKINYLCLFIILEIEMQFIKNIVIDDKKL